MTTVIGSYQIHPAADLFPLMQGAEFDVLVEDVRANGLMHPIMLDASGVLIDGRNRLRACIAADREPRVETFTGGDVIQFITSVNMVRRMLTNQQRAMIAAELANLPQGRPSENTPSGVFSSPAVTRAEAKQLMQVSEGSLHRAKIIQRDGVPELSALVKEASIPLTTAVRVAQRPQAEQIEYVAKVRSGADPISTAPAESPGKAKTSAPKPRRKHRKTIEAVINGLDGYRMALVAIDSLDDSITSEEAAQWVDDLSKAMTQFRRIQNLLKECSK